MINNEPTSSADSVVALDGPAGSGKSTVAKKVAAELGVGYLDTGAMYRAVTFAALSRGVDPEDAELVTSLAQNCQVDIAEDGTVLVDRVDATTQIRSAAVSAAVSAVSAHPGVRKELVSRQREWVHRRGGGVLDGRDIGTAVFPDAGVKVFLTASAQERARRRHQQNPGSDVAEILAAINRRDALDSGRVHDPLAQAQDAVNLDTTGLSIDDVVAQIVDLARRRL